MFSLNEPCGVVFFYRPYRRSSGPLTVVVTEPHIQHRSNLKQVRKSKALFAKLKKQSTTNQIIRSVLINPFGVYVAGGYTLAGLLCAFGEN